MASLRVGALGFAVEWTLPRATYPLQWATGLLFDGGSLLVDPAQRRLLGGFPMPPPAWPRTLAPNARHAYRARRAPASPPGKTRFEVQCFDTRTFTQSGSFSLDVPDPRKRASSGTITLDMLGDSGITLRMDSAVVLAPRVLNCLPGCAPDAPVPALTPLAAPDATDATAGVLAYSKLQVADLQHHRVSGELFASIKDTDPRQPNRVLSFAGDTGALRSSVHVGSNPGPLALSNDGSALYVGLARAAQIVSIDLTSGVVAPWLFLPPSGTTTQALHYPSLVDIETVPGTPDAIAFAADGLDEGSGGLGAWLYRAGVTRPLFSGLATRVESIAFVDDHTLWLNSPSVTKASLAPDGTPSLMSIISGGNVTHRLTLAGGNKVVTDTGVVFDAQSGNTLGQLPVAGAVAVNEDGGRILVVSRVSGAGQSGFALRCYDSNTLLQTGMTVLSVPSNFDSGANQPAELECFGASRVAFRNDGDSLLLYPKARFGVSGC